MSAPSRKSEGAAPDLEQLLELARRAQPGESSPTDARRLARRAVLASHERRRARRAGRSVVLAAFAFGAIVLMIASSPVRRAAREGLTALLAPSSTEPSRTPPPSASTEPLELSLPRGHRLFGSPGAQFELLENTDAARRIALRDGTAVFAVEPLARDEQFSVQTPHARVVVRGTVFSVEVDAQRTRVRVHEGAVLVETKAGMRSLRAGERYGSDALPVPELVSEPLGKRIAALVVERMQRRADEASARERGPLPDASVGPGHEPPMAPRARAAPVAELRAPVVTLEQARAFLLDGAVQAALAAARARHAAHESRGEWLMVQGDALRALDEPQQAVEAYQAAQAVLRGAARARAAFKAADLLLRVVDDPSAALVVLDRARLDAPRAPLRERALVLRVEASHRLGHPVRELALRYLADYPDSAGAARMRELSTSP
jgi:hypothetical protein